MSDSESAPVAPAVGDSVFKPPLADIVIWPHRSLSRRGYVYFLIILALGLAMPVMIIAGAPRVQSAAAWTAVALIGGCAAAALIAVRWALRANYRAADVYERIRVWRHVAHVRRGGRRCAHPVDFRAAPHWLRLEFDETDADAPRLSLCYSGQTIDLGAFLSPDERRGLYGELESVLARAQG